MCTFYFPCPVNPGLRRCSFVSLVSRRAEINLTDSMMFPSIQCTEGCAVWTVFLWQVMFLSVCTVWTTR